MTSLGDAWFFVELISHQNCVQCLGNCNWKSKTGIKVKEHIALSSKKMVLLLHVVPIGMNDRFGCIFVGSVFMGCFTLSVGLIKQELCSDERYRRLYFDFIKRYFSICLSFRSGSLNERRNPKSKTTAITGRRGHGIYLCLKKTHLRLHFGPPTQGD